MTTIHMPTQMKLLCSKVMEQGIEHLVPTDLENATLRWACTLAKKKAHMEGNAFWWWHQADQVWLRFGKRKDGVSCLMQLGVEKDESPMEVTA